MSASDALQPHTQADARGEQSQAEEGRGRLIASVPYANLVLLWQNQPCNGAPDHEETEEERPQES